MYVYAPLPPPCASRSSQMSSEAPDLLKLTDGCKLPCGYWELDLGPLQEQEVLLAAEPSLRAGE